MELETDCDKLILAGKRLRSLSVMKEYFQQNYEGIAFNLKHMPLPSITGRINVSALCIQFPDVAFVQDDSGKMNVVGLKDNVDFCIEALARNTQPKKYATKMDVESTRTTEAYTTKHNRRFSDNMEPPQFTTTSKQTDTFPVEEDILKFFKVHGKDQLRKVKGRYELHCTENTDTDDCVNVWFTDHSGNTSQEQLNKFIGFYQEVYTTITRDTLSLGPAAAECIESEFKAMRVPCLLKEISTGTFKATYYIEQKQVVRDIVRQISAVPSMQQR